MGQIIIHVDMDAFYASVEIRDNPDLADKPVIIGAMPDQRGVVSTCNYVARKFGVRSGMNIKEAYRLCPDGVYMHPDFKKYMAVSEKLHGIWDSYATASEPIALDETFLDVTETAGTFDKAAEFAHEIKRRTKEEIGLTCSVGLAYCKSAAKIASEEKKPDGYFEIRTREDFVSLMSLRDIRNLFSVGPKTEERLNSIGIRKIKDIVERKKDVERVLGKQGSFLYDLARGIDDRKVEAYNPEDAKSVSRELTFQKDVSDFTLIMDIILLISMSVEQRALRYGHKGNGVSLKITYGNMKSVSRMKNNVETDGAVSIARAAWDMLRTLPKEPIRLVGVGVFNFAEKKSKQTTLFIDAEDKSDPETELEHYLKRMNTRYRFDFVKNKEWILQGESMHGIAEHMRIQRARSSEVRRS